MTQYALWAAPQSAPEPVPTRDEVMVELRELITDLRDVAQDGRMFAGPYAQILTQCVDEYCVKFEHRAERALAHLEQTQ